MIGRMRTQVAVDEDKVIGAGCQTNGLVAPGVLLTLSILRLKSVPDPFSGVKSSEKADMRRVLSVPGPVLRMFEETFQLPPPVSPAACTCGVAKVTTAESKVKSALEANVIKAACGGVYERGGHRLNDNGGDGN